MKSRKVGPSRPDRTLILWTLSAVFGVYLLVAEPATAKADNFNKIGSLPPASGDASTPSESIFATSYYSLGVGKNFPIDRGNRQFQPGYYHPTWGYRYVLNDSWLMGLSAQFKVLKAKYSGQAVGLFSVEEQSQKIIRLYHPCYLLLGAKLIYLLPANRPRLPVQKNNDFGIEIGAGGTMSLIYLIAKSAYVGAYIDQWRGTKTTRLQAIETGFFAAIALGK